MEVNSSWRQEKHEQAKQQMNQTTRILYGGVAEMEGTKIPTHLVELTGTKRRNRNGEAEAMVRAKEMMKKREEELKKTDEQREEWKGEIEEGIRITSKTIKTIEESMGTRKYGNGE